MTAYKISNRERAKLLAHIRKNLAGTEAEHAETLSMFEKVQRRIPSMHLKRANFFRINDAIDWATELSERLDDLEKVVATYASAIRILSENKPAKELVNAFKRYMPHWDFRKYRRPGRRERHDAYIRKHMWDGCTNMCIDYGD